MLVNLDHVYSMGHLKTMYRDYKNSKYLADTPICPKQEGLNPMITETKTGLASAVATIEAPKDPATEKRRHLFDRLYQVKSDLYSGLRDQFKMDFTWRPKTVQEALKRLQDGKYTLDGADKKDAVKYQGLTYHFSWRTKDDLADEDGFKLAYKELEKAHQTATDTIKIVDPVQGLETLRSFEAWKPTGKAN